MSKLRDLIDALEEEVFPTGTIRKWASGSVIKNADGSWSPYTKGVTAKASHAVPADHKPSKVPAPGATPTADVLPKAPIPGHAVPIKKDPIEDTLSELDRMHDKGILPLSGEGQRKVAQHQIEQHKKHLATELDTIQNLAVGEGTAVMGRVKNIESALGKITLKPKYGTVANLKDLTGMRMVCNSVSDVLKNVEKIKAEYETSPEDEEDYINKPKAGYRSYHLIVKGKEDGKWKELQIRTPNQDTWANWCHDIYKPHTDDQKKAIDKQGKDILKYGEDMSEYYFNKDSGQEAKKPPDCPDIVKETFGCMPT